MSKKIWMDETGMVIPNNRITASEKLREQVCDRLLKNAQQVSIKLENLKDQFSADSAEVYEAVLSENGVNPDTRKGNFTFFNFDRSIKIEVAINERIEFDDALISVAKEHFDAFLDNATGSGVDDMIRELISDAFSTSRGKLDTKKVLNLTRYRSKIDAAKYPKFHQAIDAIEKAIRKPTSKRYHRISVRNDDGEYVDVNLNFSSL